ncbi:hypothetical protein PBY51_016724 [Eleginops maclovinus]|uniref:Uncharacterized protein n=1 Tax=Eleginops maclovinus TaxID=56733 RepID=A0AAN7WL74_ELEMC|nr:hypothetical protein PBY51_016724 [Eleginops maclovinus]
MEANRQGRYHLWQPPENKLTSRLLPPSEAMGSIPEMMCGFIGVDVRLSVKYQRDGGIDSGDDEEILMHIYQLIKGAVTTGQAAPSLALEIPSLLTLLHLLLPHRLSLSSRLIYTRRGVPTHSSAV